MTLTATVDDRAAVQNPEDPGGDLIPTFDDSAVSGSTTVTVVAEKGEQAQARGFAGHCRGRQNGVERDVVGHGIPASVRLGKNMQIYLYVK